MFNIFDPFPKTWAKSEMKIYVFVVKNYTQTESRHHLKREIDMQTFPGTIEHHWVWVAYFEIRQKLLSVKILKALAQKAPPTQPLRL